MAGLIGSMIWMIEKNGGEKKWNIELE